MSARQFHPAAGTADRRALVEGAYAYYRTGPFEGGLALVAAIGGVGAADVATMLGRD